LLLQLERLHAVALQRPEEQQHYVGPLRLELQGLWAFLGPAVVRQLENRESAVEVFASASWRSRRRRVWPIRR